MNSPEIEDEPPFFMDDSPPVVKTRDQIIAEIMGKLEFLLKNQISSMLAACRPKQPILSFNRADRSKQAAKGGIQALHHRYKESTIRSLRQTPPGLKNTLYDLFTNAKQSDFLTDDTIKGIPPEVIENFMKIKNSELRKAADGSRQLVSKANYFRVLDLDSMSERNKQIIFNELQKKELLRLINELTSAGIEIVRMKGMETRITHGLSLSIDDIFFLTNKYIEYQYNIASPPITSIEQLLKFITDKHQILFAIMAPYYGDDSDFAKFQSYVTLLDRFIFLVLQEPGSSISFADSPDKIAEWIISIIRHNICKFVGIAGDPDLVIRTIILNRHIIPLIIKGVQDFLNDTVPDTVAQGGGAIAAEGGNRRRIKKYKNRTSRRSSRRTSRRTSRVTKYRTNRYKIKNKKTRKIR
jgi:hypothetical protein